MKIQKPAGEQPLTPSVQTPPKKTATAESNEKTAPAESKESRPFLQELAHRFEGAIEHGVEQARHFVQNQLQPAKERQSLFRLMVEGAPEEYQPNLEELSGHAAESILDNESFFNKMIDLVPNDEQFQVLLKNVQQEIERRVQSELQDKTFANEEEASEAALGIAGDVRREALRHPESFF